jgi:hypothetical protein
MDSLKLVFDGSNNSLGTVNVPDFSEFALLRPHCETPEGKKVNPGVSATHKARREDTGQTANEASTGFVQNNINRPSHLCIQEKTF